MITVTRGRIAEAKVVAELVEQGYEVYLPTFGNGICDLIAMDSLGVLTRVEVKYTSHTKNNRSFEVGLRSVRANKTDMTVRKFETHRCDVLAVYVAPLDAVGFFDVAAYAGRSSLSVTAHVLLERRQLATQLVSKTSDPTKV